MRACRVTVFKHGDPVRMRAHTLTTHTTGTITGVTPEGRVLVRWDDNHAITEQVPHYLTPLGEPMATGQHFTGKDGIDLEIVTMNGGHFGIDVHHFGAQIPDELAPAIALAILEAAGIQAIPFDELAETEPGHAVWALRHHVQESAAKAKEAADREALESDAVSLHEAWRSGLHNTPTTAWVKLPDYHRAAWIGVARAARAVREMTGVKA